jgi:cytidine deaminase
LHPRTITTDDLVAEAARVRARARAPYSRFAVGASVVDSDGRVARGCNVENASYGLTMCAERVALFAAVAEGFGDIVSIAVVGGSERPCSPCGACRQVLSELCASATLVVLEAPSGARTTTTVGALLPGAFSSFDLTDSARDAEIT